MQIRYLHDLLLRSSTGRENRTLRNPILNYAVDNLYCHHDHDTGVASYSSTKVTLTKNFGNEEEVAYSRVLAAMDA